MTWMSRFLGGSDADEPASSGVTDEEIRELFDPRQERSMIIDAGKATILPQQVLENVRHRMERIDLDPGTSWMLPEVMSWEEMAVMFTQLNMGSLMVSQTAEYARQILSRWPAQMVQHAIPPEARIERSLPGVDLDTATQDLGRRVINRALGSPTEVLSHPELDGVDPEQLAGAWISVLFWFTVKSGALNDRCNGTGA